MGDATSLHTSRLIDRAVTNVQALAPGIITAYDKVTHQVQAQRQPQGDILSGLMLGTPFKGMAHPVVVGDQCLIAYVGGVPHSVLCVFHSKADEDAPPTGSMAVEGETFFGGRMTVAGGVLIPPAFVLPTPTTEDRGTLRPFGRSPDGVAGTADKLYWCAQKSDGTLAWIEVATG